MQSQVPFLINWIFIEKCCMIIHYIVGSTSNRYNIHLTLTWLGFLGVCFELCLWQRRWGKDCEKTWYLAHAYRQIYFHNLCFAVLKSPKIYWYTFFWPTHYYLLTWVLFYVKVVLFSKYIMKLGLCKSFLIQFTIFHFLKLEVI